MRKLAYIAMMGWAVLAACGKQQDVADMSGEADMAQAGDMAQAAVMERRLDVSLTLSGTRLVISVRDGGKPVMTDLWLYTLEGGKQRPFGAFAEPDSRRKSRRRMMPCDLGGQPSGLTPCDEGEENGVMTDAVREKIEGGKRSSAINGDVELMLTGTLTQPLLVVAGLEDQRYAGAAALTADGKPMPPPADVGVPGPVARPRSYERDVAPMFKTRCVGCHGDRGPAAFFRLGSYADIVERDFLYEEGIAACAKQFPNDEPRRKDCESKVTGVEYMIELGAPALSPLARRTRPDEMKSTSPEGLKWYGSGGKRYGDHGDRRMPPENITADPMDDKNGASRFDQSPAEFQLLFDWIAQGAPR